MYKHQSTYPINSHLQILTITAPANSFLSICHFHPGSQSQYYLHHVLSEYNYLASSIHMYNVHFIYCIAALRTYFI